MRTRKIQNTNRDDHKKFSFLCSVSKEVYNTNLFTHKFFDKCKNDIYKNLFIEINNYPDKFKSIEVINDYILDIYKTTYIEYSNNFKQINENNNVAYSFITNYLKDKQIDSTNYYNVFNQVLIELEHHKEIIWNTENKKLLFTDVVSNILEKIYCGKFFSVKNDMFNKKPIKEENIYLIKEVENDSYLFKNKYTDNINCKKWISDLLFYKNNNKTHQLKFELYVNLFNELKQLCFHYMHNIQDISKNINQNNIYIFISALKVNIVNIFSTIKRIINISDKIYKTTKEKLIDRIILDELIDKLIKIMNELPLLKNVDDKNIKNYKNITEDIINALKCLEKEKKNFKFLEKYNINCVTKYVSIFDEVNKMRLSVITTNPQNLNDYLIKLKKIIGNELFTKLEEIFKEIKIEKTKFCKFLDYVVDIMVPNSDKLNLTTDESIVETLTRNQLNKTGNNEKLPSDVINNIFKKVQQNINSYYELRKNGRKFAKYPKFLKKGSKFGIYYLNMHAMKFIEEESRIDLFVGKYLNKKCADFTKGNIILLNEGVNYSKYAKFDDMEKVDKKTKIKRKDYYLYKLNEEEYYIDKKSPKIIEGGKITINISNCMFDKNKKPIFETIDKVEIVPTNKGYNIHLTYTPIEKFPKVDEKQNFKPEDCVSIDLGTVNVGVMYDPEGNQYIIKGNEIISINNYFSKKIANEKSKLKKINNVYTSNRLNYLNKKRDNIINNMFDNIVKWLFKTLKNKKLIIIGYNVNWKKSPKLGKRQRKIFMEIPYRKLINKIFDKGEKLGIIIKETGEAYTSKCDSLSLEEVCKHEKYEGKRITRSLYKSKNGKIINADLNGAINIMRKYFKEKGMLFEKVTGNKILNPKIAKITGYTCGCI